MADTLRQYVELQKALATEKVELERRLAAITEALAGTSTPVAKPGRKPGAKPGPRPKAKTATPPAAKGISKRGPQPGRGRGGNPMSLKVAIQKVTRAKALSKKEIMAAIDKIGYKFTTKNPLASLNNALYTKGLFHKQGGKFKAA